MLVERGQQEGNDTEDVVTRSCVLRFVPVMLCNNCCERFSCTLPILTPLTYIYPCWDGAWQNPCLPFQGKFVHSLAQRWYCCQKSFPLSPEARATTHSTHWQTTGMYSSQQSPYDHTMQGKQLRRALSCNAGQLCLFCFFVEAQT